MKDSARNVGAEETALAAEMAFWCADRANCYRFLARLHYEELTGALMEEIAQRGAPEAPADGSDGERDFAQGLRKMALFCERTDDDALTQSRCDFAYVLLGAGQPHDEPVAPYESVYAAEGRLVMQAPRDEMCAALAAEHLAVADNYRMPEDHLTFQFQYEALLLDAMACALDSLAGSASADEAAQIREQVRAAQEKARAFYENHLANWVPQFCREARALARTAFYRGLGLATGAWMALEGESFAEAAALLADDETDGAQREAATETALRAGEAA